MYLQKFYKTLAESKADIENVLKQGRSIVDKRQVDNTDELTLILDNLKQKYNELGLRVTTGKNELEKAFKIAKKFRKEYNLINEFLSKIDGELKKVEQKPLSKNYLDELEWINNTRFEINKVENNIETLKNLQKSLQEFVKNKEKILHESLNKVKEVEDKLKYIVKRLDNRASFIQVNLFLELFKKSYYYLVFLKEESKLLEESYQSFLVRIHELHNIIETTQQNLINIERNNDKDRFQVC